MWCIMNISIWNITQNVDLSICTIMQYDIVRTMSTSTFCAMTNLYLLLLTT